MQINVHYDLIIWWYSFLFLVFVLGGDRDHLAEMRDARRDLLHDTRSVSRCIKETAIYLGCFSRLYAFIHEVRKCDYVVLTI